VTLADTPVWIDHFRRGNAHLAEMLIEGQILMHPLVAGELACGNLRERAALLSYLRTLPQAMAASHTEVEHFLEAQAILGRGLGWIDVSLLASAQLTGCDFWTLDRRLAAAALKLGLEWGQ
jgi:predicted nucleic acid-binding protein